MATETPLPPGTTGLPLLGETLPFLRDPFGFIRDRSAQHGPVFRTHVLGRRAAVLVGPEATARFLERPIGRAESMPAHVQELFGGVSLPLLDGRAHRARKGQILAAFTRDAMASYLPEMSRQVAAALSRWAGQREVVLVPELKQLALEIICATIIGIAPGPETVALGADYARVLHAFTSLPIPVPGTPFGRGRAAMGRILKRFSRAVRGHQATPQEDGLGRILLATDENGQKISAQDCAIELHHLIIAGLVVFAELAAILLDLDRHPQIRSRLAAEIGGIAGEVTPDGMARTPELMRFVLEVKRTCPIVPVVFAKAQEDFEFGGYRIPAGWMVLWAVFSSLQASEVYTAPERFDPERFAAGRAEHLRHPHGYAPQGAGPAEGHRCAGTDFATCVMEVFAIQLLRGYQWQLPSDQDLDLDWSRIPPEPKSGLRVHFEATR
jgi:cytochrome P450